MRAAANVQTLRKGRLSVTGGPGRGGRRSGANHPAPRSVVRMENEGSDHVVELVRERHPGEEGEHVGVGLTFARAPDGTVTIAAVQPGSAAQKSSKFGRGQRVNAINGWSVHGLSPDRVFQMLLGPERSRVQIAVGKMPQNEETKYNFHSAHRNAVESRARFEESMQKTTVAGYIGISFTSGIVGKHRITDIVPTGPAGGHGILRVGDIIASIDGITCADKSNQEVKDMISGPAESWITLEVQRPGTTGVKLALQRVANIRPDAASSPPHAYQQPDPHGVPRPAQAAVSQHGAYLNENTMAAVKPVLQQGIMSTSKGGKHLLMEQKEEGTFSKEVPSDAAELFSMPAGTVQCSIYYAKHLPVKTVFGLSDSYVQVVYESNRMRTRTVLRNLDPKYETTMRFPAGDCVNALTISVFQVGGIGSDLQIGQITLPYADLARGVNKEFALFGADGSEVVGLKGQTTVLCVRAMADMRESNVADLEHRKAEREWAAQAMALQAESRNWPSWMPSEHAHKYGLDPDMVDEQGLKPSERTQGLTLRLEEDFEEAKKQERVFAQHLINDLATATDSHRSRFQYVGIEKGSVLATLNVKPSKRPEDTRSALNVVSEITIQAYDPSSKLRRLPCTYTVRSVQTHPARKPPARLTWAMRNWFEGVSSAPPPAGPVDTQVASTDLGGDQRPVFGVNAALPVMHRVSAAPPPDLSQIVPPIDDGQPTVPKEPVGFLASATVLDNVMSQSGVSLPALPTQPEPSTVISNKHAVAKPSQSERESAASQSAKPTNAVAALFNSLMSSFAGRSEKQHTHHNQGKDRDYEVKLLVKQAKYILQPRAHRQKVYFCASVLAVGNRLDENVSHQVSRSAHIDSLPPEALSRAANSPTSKYELVAQYRSQLVGVESDLVTFEWEESVKMRECIAGIEGAEPSTEELQGQAVQLLLTVHGSDAALGDETIGWTLVPMSPDTEVNHWFPLMDTAGQIKNVDHQQSCVHLSYSYAGIGERGKAANPVEGDNTEASANIDRSLVPTDIVHAEQRPHDTKAGSVADGSVSVRSSVPKPNQKWNFVAVKNAVKALKALAAQGYELVLVGQGDLTTAKKALVGLTRLGLVAGETGPVKPSNVVFVHGSRDKGVLAQQLGGLVSVVDHDVEALQAVAEDVEDGTQCVLFMPSRDGRRKFLEATMKRETDEAELARSMTRLAHMRTQLRHTELALANVGVDMRAQSRYTPKEEDPEVRRQVQAFVGEEIQVAEEAKKVKQLLLRTSSPMMCVPTARNEMGLMQLKKPDPWEEACQSLGLDPAVIRVYDERPAFDQMLHPSPADPPPFYPLAAMGSPEALLRMPERIEKWEIAKRKGAHPERDRVGVGMSVESGLKGEAVVTAVEHGGSAFLSRAVAVGDVLVSIDGEVLLGMEVRDVQQRLMGKMGSMVLVELHREGEDAPIAVVLERKETAPAFAEGKGRIMVGMDGVVLIPQIDDDSTKGGRIRISVGAVNHLPQAVNTEALFCLVKVSPATATAKPTVMRSDLVPVSPPPFSSCLFDAKFETDVQLLAKQRVTVELFWPDPFKRSGVLLGACELSCEQLVASNGSFRSLTLLDGGSPVRGTDQEDCKLQLAGELIPVDKEAVLREQAKKHKEASQALQLQETVGVSLVLDEDYSRTVGVEDSKRLAFANELKLDLAAALYTSEDRFQVCGLQPGSVIAHVNILQDLSGGDPREPKALAKLLTNQVVDKASPLHWAQTTRNVISISTSGAFRAPLDPKAAPVAGQPDDPGADRELAPRERALAEREKRLSVGGGALADGVGRYGPRLGKPENELNHKERQGASLNALADGMMRSQEPALFAEPATVCLSFNEQLDQLDEPRKQAQLLADIATILFLPVEALDVGGIDLERRSMDVVVFPFSAEAAEKIKDNMELARKMVPGVQHMIAAQLVSQVFDKSSALWQVPGLDNITWAQVLRQPLHEYTKKAIKRMKGEDVARDPTGGLGVAAAARHSQQQAATGEGLKSSAPPEEKAWVASPTLGMVWEELVDRTGEPYWVNHKQKLVSYSHPKYHWPLPKGWTQHVDDRRRVYYSVPGQKRTQWEHPCSPTVVYGVVIQGHSETAVQFRDWVRTHGWKDLRSKLELEPEPWARDLQVEDGGNRMRVLDAPSGQTKTVVAAYTFSMQWEEVPIKERGMQPLPPPGIGEDFVTLDANMVALMMSQYPQGYYMLFKPTLQRVRAIKGFTTVWVTCMASNGEVVHRKVTVVGAVKSEEAHPGFQNRYEGWAITEVEEPWRMDPAEMLERGLMFSSLAVLLQTHPEEFVIRVDPEQEIPSCRFVRKTWGQEELPPDLVEDMDALSRPLMRRVDVEAKRERDAKRKQLEALSPEVQKSLLTMGTLPRADAIGGLAEQQAAAMAAGLSEVDILPFEDRPGYTEFTVHLRRGALKAGNKDGLSGIGVVLQALHNPDDPYMVVEVEPSGPAGLSQQVEVGDILLAVDSYQTRSLTLADVIQRIKGPPFAPVTLFLRRKDAATTNPFE